MDQITISAFFDEFHKIAVAGGQLSPSSVPKTSAPTPAPTAKLAPTPAAKPPATAPVGPPGGGIRNPGLRSQAQNMQSGYPGVNAPAPKLDRGTLLPKKTPAPNVRSVTTMPVREPAKPAFLPDSRAMRSYLRPMTRSGLGI